MMSLVMNSVTHQVNAVLSIDQIHGGLLTRWQGYEFPEGLCHHVQWLHWHYGLVRG